MSYAIGSRIKELRTARGINQERMAEILNTSRQRYSRLEKGQVDISFVLIKKIAQIFAVPTSEITSVLTGNEGLPAYFREKNASDDVLNRVAKIEEIIRVFWAHEKLYYQMKARGEHADQ